MYGLHMHPDIVQKLAKQEYQSLLCEAKQRRLIRHLPASRLKWGKQVAHQLGHLLVQLGSRLQEQQRPIL